jgi:hypothetical protein
LSLNPLQVHLFYYYLVFQPWNMYFCSFRNIRTGTFFSCGHLRIGIFLFFFFFLCRGTYICNVYIYILPAMLRVGTYHLSIVDCTRASV